MREIGMLVMRIRRPLALAVSALLLVLGLGAAWLFRAGNQSEAPGVTQTVQAGDLQVTLRLDEPALGERVVDVVVQDAAGDPVALRGARLRFAMAEMDMGEIEAAAQPIAAGRVRARGSFFTMAGRWTVEATLDRAGAASLRVPFIVTIAAPGEVSGPLNPLTADEPTLAGGRRLYQANCVVCHGAHGGGDGPAALALNPRPSDFTQHMLPGKHTDGQVFLWIKDGYPGTAMPAWGQRLDDQQIWQLVTYLRTFGQRAASASQPDQPTAPPPEAQPTQPRGEFATLPPLIFARQGNLWRSDGSRNPPRPITNLGAGSYAEYPAQAPDGSRIAFVVTTQGSITETTQLPLPVPKTRLYRIRADGSDLRVLWAPERGVLGLPAWAPDGRALYVGYADVRSAPDAPVPDRLFQVMRVDVGTGARRVLLNDARDPAMSRDGKTLAYLRFDQAYAAFALHTAAPDGTNDREVVGSSAFADLAAPRLSPDGRRIVFAAQGGPATDSQGYPIKARRPSPLQALAQLFAPPMAEAHGAPWDIWIVDSDGASLRRLTAIREDSPMAVFSPDGKEIAVMGAGGIYRMNADGSGLRKLDPIGDHGGLDWGAHS